MMTETVVTVQDAPNSNAAKQPDRRHPLDWIKLNLNYFGTVPGIIKIVELVLGIFCMALAKTDWERSTHWFLFVATVSFIGTLIWVFIYLTGIREATSNYPINWILTETVNTGIVTVCYAIAFIIQLSVWVPSNIPTQGVNVAAGVFGLFETLVYGYGTFLLYLESKRT